MQDILSVSVISDGLIFDQSSIKSTRILEDADYQGINIMFLGKLDAAKIYVQIDIGFGDIVYPQPEKATLPTLLDLPAPSLLCYSKESVIAEKFDAMVTRGMTNSRMKDFYDIWLLSRKFNFDAHKLTEAIKLTFGQRQTEIPIKIEAFSNKFIDAKPSQWEAFRKRLRLVHAPESFQEVVSAVKAFLEPISSAMSSGVSILKKWDAPGPWV